MYLRSQGQRLNSRVLSALAQHANDDPFTKVKKMIKDLITRLMEEANDEAEHKGWCDTELSTNEQTRKEKTEAVETLHAEIDQLEASIQKLTQDIAALTEAVAALDAAMAKATKLRQEEKAENLQTIADAGEAQTAVAQAIVVLKDFYSKVDKAAKVKDIEHKTAKKQDEEQALQVKREDLEGTQKELDAALAYFDKLKPSCVDAGVSYESRVARRQEEIESLQEALKILNGEDIA